MSKLERVLFNLDLLFDIKSIDEAKVRIKELKRDISILQDLLKDLD